MTPPLQMQCDYNRQVNFALQQNDVPVVRTVELHNALQERLLDVEVRISADPAVWEPWSTRILSVEAGSTYTVRMPQLALSPERLAAQSESEKGWLHIDAFAAGQPVGSAVLDFEILAYNHWSGLRSLPELLAAFVLPNQPAVTTVLKIAQGHLERLVGDRALNGYQGRSRQRVLAIAASVYGATQELGVSYINPPASFEQEGQKIRLPDQLLADQMGTCLDLTVLIAACLEQAGLHPIICMVDGHAFPGVWLDDFSLPEPAISDPSAIRKRVDGEEAIVFDSSTVAQGADFRHATVVGRRYLDANDRFLCAIDVARARKARVRPLPIRRTEAGWGADPEANPTDALTAPVANLPELRLPSAAADGVVKESTRSRLDRWKSKLLDLSLHNRLLNTRFSLGTIVPLKGTDIAAEYVGDLEDLLAAGTSVAVLPRPDAQELFGPRSPELMEQRVHDDAMGDYLSTALRNRRIHADLTPSELLKRLTKLYRDSRTAIEESGSNTLYLAIGFLCWYEDENSQTERFAPLVLLPVQLDRGSGHNPFQLKATDDEPRINVTLLKKLENDFGIDVRGLDEMPEDASGIDIHLILHRFRRAVMDMPRWDVRSDAAVSEFSFSKYLMWVDLEERTDTLLTNPLFRHIMEGQGAAYPLSQPLVATAQIDRDRPVQDDLCVVDADSSQLAAVFSAKDGNSFVLQGPPGTGKSQTITNLIAQLVGDGKTVLFVSEKMAALEVVHRRLVQAGLGEFCLEVHSNKSSKAHVVQQLAVPFGLVGRQSASEWASHADALHALRTSLNQLADALHRPGPYGASVFGAASAAVRHQDAPPVRLAFDRPEDVTLERVNRLRRALEAIVDGARDIGDPSTHPWHDVPVRDWSPRSEQAIAEALDLTQRHAEQVTQAAPAAAEALGLNLPSMTDATLDRLERAVGVLETSPGPPRGLLQGQAWTQEPHSSEGLKAEVAALRKACSEVGDHFTKDLLSMDLTPLRARFDRWAEAFFIIAFFMLWRARRFLRSAAQGGKVPSNRTVRDCLRGAQRVKECETAISQQSNAIGSFLGPLWRGLSTDWNTVDAAIRWAESYRTLVVDLDDEMAGGALLNDLERRETLLSLATDERGLLAADRPRGQAMRRFRDAWRDYREARTALLDMLGFREETNPLAEVLADLPRAGAQMTAWRGAMRTLRDWCAWRDAVEDARDDSALAEVIRSHEAGRLSHFALLPAFERGLSIWWVEEAVGADPVLRAFRGTSHDARIERFRQLDRQLQSVAREELRARLASQIPSVNGPGEVALLRTELKKQRRHMPIRKLFSRIPHTLVKLKPCLLMSPLSVAQYLDPGLSEFDVVVFDEASQIPPWDAVGAIARGHQRVVVGDSKQLPPTSFFQKSDDELPDDDDMEELESILDECIRAGFRSHSLKWHYRSRHESLIAFSNHQYYDNSLHTFPAADQDVPELGVKWRHVPGGYYDKGKSRTNPAEARAVVAEIERRLTDPKVSSKSIGVVTFSQAQQSSILDLLDELRRRRPEIEHFFTEAFAEPVFVKNLENVQGDERDVVLFSICYGPDRAGKIAMNFGPLNRDGGERRLNVAITRSRELLVVFSTLTPDQIDLDRTRAVGVSHLKTFLDYAMRGPRAIDEAVTLDPNADFDSPFEEAVCKRLRLDGWQVDLQVGCAGYRIDLAVRDPKRPGSYLLGVECDGATYHSARSARDRDRIRQKVLESLGWRLFRVWSLDWWHNPERVMLRLLAALQAAQVAPRYPTSELPQAVRERKPLPSPRNVDIGALIASQPSRLERPDQAVDYEPVETPNLGPRELWDDPAIAPEIASRLLSVVATEGPIHVAEATRRVSASWGASKATGRSMEKVLRACAGIPAETRPLQRGDYLWPAALDPRAWRLFRLHPTQEVRRAAEYLPAEEVANAAEWLISCSGSIDRDELIMELARLFGYRSTGKRVRSAMEAGIDHLTLNARAQATGTTLCSRPLPPDRSASSTSRVHTGETESAEPGGPSDARDWHQPG